MTEQNAEETAELPSFDSAALERLKRFGGGKLLGEMIALFLESAPERISSARTGVTDDDAKTAEMALHSLKSSSAQLGAMRMYRLCEQGETLSRTGQLDIVSLLVSDIEQEYPRVQLWLEAARTESTS